MQKAITMIGTHNTNGAAPKPTAFKPNSTPTVPAVASAITIGTLEQRLLTPEQAAKRLGISPRKLRQLAKDKEFPIVPIGRVVRYDVIDLDAWIVRQKALAQEWEDKKAAEWEDAQSRRKQGEEQGDDSTPPRSG
ncbi:MAG TPA: helix-turn-helix domain-containing protein [Gemmataceae bacterium]|nr:helix-turn-helix domain-containing protein [Gemmataceae bacterium]